MGLKDKYFTVSEAAEEADVTRQTISRWIATEKIRAEKIGRNILIPRRALLKYIREKPMGAVRKMVSNEIISNPFLLGCNKSDKVEVVGYPSDLRFLINHQDGSSEEIGVETFTLTIENTLRNFSCRTSKRKGK